MQTKPRQNSAATLTFLDIGICKPMIRRSGRAMTVFWLVDGDLLAEESDLLSKSVKTSTA